MEPLSFAVISVASDHLSVTNTIAVAIEWFVGINIAFIVALDAAVGVFVCHSGCNLLSRAFLMTPLSISCRCIS